MGRAGRHTRRMTLPRAVLSLLVGLLLVGGLAGGAQGWEIEREWQKEIAPGVTYRLIRYRLDTGLAAVHVITIDPYSNYEIRPVLPAGGLGSLEPVGKMAERAGAIAAINGTFFDPTQSKLPVGFLRIDYRTVFGQHLDRALLGIDPFGGVHFERTLPQITLYFEEAERELRVSRINYRRGWGDVVAYTRDFGPRTGTNRWGFELILSPAPTREPRGRNGSLSHYVVSGVAAGNAPIPEDGLVISVHMSREKELGWLRELRLGTEVTVETNLPKGWDTFPHVIGAGPLLLSAGKIVLDPRRENFHWRMNLPHARTAVARTARGKILMVVVSQDPGRELRGVTWWQLALLLRDSLGAVDALGLDGGSSSTMWIKGEYVNPLGGVRPRRVANALVVVPREYPF